MDVRSFNVLVGTNSLNHGGYRHLVKDFFIHDDFNASIGANDIGLIQVMNPIQFNDRVQPVPISAEVVPENIPLIVTGWGRLRVRYCSLIYRNSYKISRTILKKKKFF